MKKIDEIIGDARDIVIVGHIRPDGDCIGSSMGLYNYILENFGIKSRVNLMKPLPTIFAFMNGYDEITWTYSDEVVDLCICVDCGSIDRLEDSEGFFINAKRTYCIDHHLSNENIEFADERYFDPNASSTCELVFDILDKDKMSKNVAECLYTGLVTDTGLFKYNSTSLKTMTAAGFLMEKGIDFSDIVDRVFYEKTYNQNRIMGAVLTKATLVCDDKCIVGVATKEDMDHYDVMPRHLDGIINQLSNTRGVEVAVFIYELGTLCYKVSIRSKKFVDVSSIVKEFGGGGHFHAAGCTIHGNYHDVVNAITKRVALQLELKND